MEELIAKIEELPLIYDYKMKLRKKSYETSTSISIETAELFKDIINYSIEHDLVYTFKDLLSLILYFEKTFVSIDPLQFSIGNIIKRILFIIREEESKIHPFEEVSKNVKIEEEKKKTKQIKIRRQLTFQTLNNIIDANQMELIKKTSSKMDIDEETVKTFCKGLSKSTVEELKDSELKPCLGNILDNISELIDELDSMSGAIKNQTLEYIHDGDIILTSNHSEQLEELNRKEEEGEI